jgi:hypothetical protein
MSIEARCIFCDDLRQEVGAKFSIMGVYGHEMLVHSMDENFRIERLCLFVTTSFINEKPPASMIVIVKGPETDSKKEFTINYSKNPSVSSDRKVFDAATAIKIRDVIISKDSQISVAVKIGKKKILVGTLTIRRVPVSRVVKK